MNIFESIKNKFFTSNIRNPDDFINRNQISNKEQSTITHDIHQREEDSELYDNYNLYSTYGNTLINSNFTADEQIRQYRNYSLYTESTNAIEQIVNEAINRDEDGDFIKLDLSKVESKYGKVSSQPLQDEITYSYEKFCLLTDFEESAEQYFQQFYIDGILKWEAIYPKSETEVKEKGIINCQLLSPIGLKKIKIRNPITDKESFIKDNRDYISGQEADLLYSNINNEREFDPNKEYTFYYYDKSTAAADDGIHTNDNENDTTTAIIFDEEQIFGCDTGKFDPTRKIYLSYMHPCLKPLRNLYMIEDALIIYRISNSNAKRAFYVNPKSLNRKTATQYLKSLMDKYSSKMFYDTANGTISSYNTTRAINENYWFLMNPDGTKSVTIEPIEALSSFDITNMVDLDYFVKKVQEAFGVPVNRNDKQTATKNYTYDNNSTILREELKFSKKITSIKRKFVNIIYEFILRDLVARRIIGYDDWYDVKKLIKLKFHGENEFARIQKYALLLQKVEVSDRLLPYVKEHKYFSNKWLKRTVWELTDEEIEQLVEEIELETIEDTLRVGKQEEELSSFENPGSNLGSGYSGSFEPLPPEMGNVSDDAFPDFETPEEAPPPEEAPVEETPEPLTQSIKPKKNANDLILEVLEKYKERIKNDQSVTVSGIKFKKINGLFVKQD